MGHGVNEFKVRPATTADARLLWLWANDPDTRKNSFSPEPIPWESHVEWLARKLACAETQIWILESEDEPVGVIRYKKISPEAAEISYSVAARHRGRGFAAEILKMTFSLAVEDSRIRQVVGYVFPENVASIRAFQRAGYSCVAEKSVRGHACYVFERSLCTSNTASK